jgi:energy-coupling factor transport system ATP-binding protein
MSDAAVSFRSFSCAYPGQAEPTLHEIELDIAPGEFVVLSGSSGSGKTTLANAMNGIVQHVFRAATAGSVFVDGVDVETVRVSDLAGKVGMLFQEPESQFVSLYVRDEIAFGPENLLLPREEILRRMRDVMSRIGIADLGERFVYELSGGQKQKVAIAAVLAMEPKVLVLDEPTANLDPQSSSEIWQLASNLRDEGLAIVAIEKDLDEVLSIADRLVVLDRGRVRYEGGPREVVGEHGLELLDELGLWLPQTAEVETLVRSRTGRRAAYVPFTPTEALEVFAEYPISAQPIPDGVRPLPAEPDPPLRMTDVTHRYPDGTLALRGIDLTVNDADILAICGANGSGKTTLVKHFVGLLKPTLGQVEVFGKLTRTLSVREIARHVGFVFQDPEHQFVRDTVAQEVEFSLRVAGVPESDRPAQIALAIRTLGLDGLDNRHPFSLSGGEKRRLSVATATVTHPRVLILDEPTYGQDRRTTFEMMGSILSRAGGQPMLPGAGNGGNGADGPSARAIILVTHDMRLVADFATRAVVVHAGEVAFDGTPAELFRQPDLVTRMRLAVPPFLQFAASFRDGEASSRATSLTALAAALG